MRRGVLGTILLLAADCSGPDRGLEHRIAEAAAKGPGTLVRMAALTDFAWDRLHIFDPYSTREGIEADLGFAWPDADRTGIADSDGVTLLVFVKGREVVRYVVQPRTTDFAGDYPGTFAPADAVFRVTPTGDGAFHMVPERGGG